MTESRYHLNWDSYKNNICSGFSRLQQKEEFVDMTLAAEGHLVKVHKSLIALASPFIKSMLQTAPCVHPVIFLNNISHKTLCYLLEYIYTGEVTVPTDTINLFLEACKSLHIAGVERITPPKNQPMVAEESVATYKEPAVCKDERSSNIAAHITINNQDYNLQVQRFDVNMMQENVASSNVTSTNPVINIESNIAPDPGNVNNNGDDIDSMEIAPEVPDYAITDVNSSGQQTAHSDSLAPPKITLSMLNGNTKNISAVDILKGGVPKYTVSNRGCLQLMLNRYMYYCHHHSCGGRKKRWRCIDYRQLHCPAYIDTDGEILICRKGIHCHPFHDDKIMKKSKSENIFSSVAGAMENASDFQNTKSSEDDVINVIT